ncbi:PQQ-dependent sugar dehydrogenase [Vibrio maerlii]|uniref:PQQ-dependent sugar dehydrogenase n=1 Tax=Vibrio maerlii TaxID=2231648 RepID=UPI000E3CF52C|nr:PQQ-dependent sugar dehydrogenase [Vibrio maerlii]
MNRTFYSTILTLSGLITSPTLLADEVPVDESYSVTAVASGLYIPWGIEFVDNNTLIINEKNGTISKIDISSGSKQPLYSVSELYEGGQGGLLDIARSPIVPEQYYFTYSKNTSEGSTVVLAAATLNGNKLTDWQDLLITDASEDSGRHFGSRISFDDEGYLYFGVGDRGNRDNGQDTNNHAASILRLKLDGSTPTNNPFVNDDSIRDEIWSYGHRNPQGLFFDSKTQRLWEIEHGPRGGDEINLIQPTLNYGWPVTSHGKEYWGPFDVGEAEEKSGIESPKLVYVPSIAPASLVLYRGDKYPNLDGKLLAGSLKLTHINVVSIDDSGKTPKLTEEKRILDELNERIRDIAISPDGYLFLSTDNGNIYRLNPSN